MGKDHQTAIIELLVHNEETVSRLYKAYAKKFPELSHFWSQLSREEEEHADNLKRLFSKVREGSLSFKQDRFNPQAIRTLTHHLEQTLNTVQNEGMSLRSALRTALDIEDALIEKNYFGVFVDDAKELKDTFLNMQSELEKHKKRIKDALDKINLLQSKGSQ